MVRSTKLTLPMSFVIVAAFAPVIAAAHIKVVPNGRMGDTDSSKFTQNNAANPTVPDNPGPCANFNTRMTPRLLTPGQQSSVTITETINHPGRFIVQFSPANDQNFWAAANQLANIADTQNNGTTVVNFTVPATLCDACTLRVLQQMDDQPGRYYVHCLDIKISNSATTTPPPTQVESPPPTTVQTADLSSNSRPTGAKAPGMGCARVSDQDDTDPLSLIVTLLLLFAPLGWLSVARAFAAANQA